MNFIQKVVSLQGYLVSHGWRTCTRCVGVEMMELRCGTAQRISHCIKMKKAQDLKFVMWQSHILQHVNGLKNITQQIVQR